MSFSTSHTLPTFQQTSYNQPESEEGKLLQLVVLLK